jgi:hypothetical protein
VQTKEMIYDNKESLLVKQSVESRAKPSASKIMIHKCKNKQKVAKNKESEKEKQ